MMRNISHDERMQTEVVRLIPALRKFARRFHTAPHDIDDLVQDTIVKALANADKFEQGTRLQSWMFTIMRNSFCTRFSLGKREHVGMEEDVAGAGSVAAVQEWSIRGHELEQAIASLPEHHRIALKLTIIDGMSYEATAQLCNCAVGTVKSRVNRARQELTRQLKDD